MHGVSGTEIRHSDHNLVEIYNGGLGLNAHSPQWQPAIGSTTAHFGEPSSIQGDMRYWGWSQRNDIECTVADIMPHQIEFRAIDESLHGEWGTSHKSLLSKAQAD